MLSVEITGGDNLPRIVRDLRETGEGGLKRELLGALRDATRFGPAEIRAAALTKLPKSGGLAERVAGQKFDTRASVSGDTVTVRTTGEGMHELKIIDDGMVNHPVWADRRVWRRQSVVPGFFSGTLDKKGPEAHRQIDGAMRAVKRKIEKGT